MTLILALDVATNCGFARGVPGETPIAGSIRFGNMGASNNAVFAHCLRWLSAELQPEPRPDMLIIEALLPPSVMAGKTTAGTYERLGGLHGIVRAVAHLRGVHQIAEHTVGNVRRHFLGPDGNKIKSDRAKLATIHKCRALGWACDDHNAADALALWCYAACLIDPKLALQLSPLFNKQLRAAEYA